MAFHNQKCVQLVQGVIMLISITTSLLLFNFEKNISYVFLFLRNFKLLSSQFLMFTLFCFREKNGEKTLQLTSINLVCMRWICDALRESPWRVAPEKQQGVTKLQRQRQGERQKAIGLMSKTTTLDVHHAFLYFSLPSLHNNDVK